MNPTQEVLRLANSRQRRLTPRQMRKPCSGRHSLRRMMECRRRGPGNRSLPRDRPTQACLHVPVDRYRHGRRRDGDPEAPKGGSGEITLRRDRQCRQGNWRRPAPALTEEDVRTLFEAETYEQRANVGERPITWPFAGPFDGKNSNRLSEAICALRIGSSLGGSQCLSAPTQRCSRLDSRLESR